MCTPLNHIRRVIVCTCVRVCVCFWVCLNIYVKKKKEKRSKKLNGCKRCCCCCFSVYVRENKETCNMHPTQWSIDCQSIYASRALLLLLSTILKLYVQSELHWTKRMRERTKEKTKQNEWQLNIYLCPVLMRLIYKLKVIFVFGFKCGCICCMWWWCCCCCCVGCYCHGGGCCCGCIASFQHYEQKKFKIRAITFYPVATKIDKFQAPARTVQTMLCHSHRSLMQVRQS